MRHVRKRCSPVVDASTIASRCLSGTQQPEPGEDRSPLLIDEGCAQEDVWRELLDVIERKSKLASREWRRVIDLEQFISAEQAIVLITAVVDAVRRHITDPRKLSQISREIGALYGAGQQIEDVARCST